MKPFTEYLNDSLVQASQSVLSRNTDNTKAVRASKREAQLLKTREKSLADKRKRAGLTGGQSLKFVEEKTVKIIATADHGAIRKGQTFITTAKTNNMGQTRLVIKDEDMPRMTMGPTLFLDKDGKPNDGGAWSRFAIVEASILQGQPAQQLKELYSIKTSAVRTLMAEFTSLDAVELEDFFKAAQAYFAEEGDEFDNDDFNDLSIIMDKAAKRWHDRATN